MKARIIRTVLLWSISFVAISQNDIDIPDNSKLVSHTRIATNNIDIKISEDQLNSAFRVLADGRAINFGNYMNQYGINAYYLNMDRATVDIQPNNKVILNAKLSGGINLNLWSFSATLTGEISGIIEGTFSVRESGGGYSLFIVPTIPYYEYTGDLQAVANFILNLTNLNINDYISDIEISLGKSILPERISRYFKSGIPHIFTNSQELILRFESLFDDMEVQNRILKPGESATYIAGDYITLKDGFEVRNGASFYAAITPKPLNRLKTSSLEDSEIPDTVTTSNLKCIHSEAVLFDENITGMYNTNPKSSDISVYPNPFSHTVSAEGPNSLSMLNVKIFDMQGKMIFEKENIGFGEKLDLSHLAEGTYVLRFWYENTTYTQKMIKTE